MRIIPELETMRDELVAIRRDIHAHPELAYQEHRTADLVAGYLEDLGLQVHRGLGRTGVVGTLRGGEGPTVGLRADMDALPIVEANDVDYRSRFDGRMHACGHDGHTTMLLGAAKYLARHASLRGTVHFIFQPAEEGAGGAPAMMNDGLFERFPVEAVFGMHNWPGLDVGKFAMRPGPMMASFDAFDIKVAGKGTHAALPHHGIDPIVVSAAMIQSLQTIVSRSTDPLHAAVVSVTKVHAGDAYNIIPGSADLAGCVRCFDADTRAGVLERIRRTVEMTARAAGADASVDFRSVAPAVVNEVRFTRLAAEVAAGIVGESNVDVDARPVMGSEDFAFMLEKLPGCYVFIGNGAGEGSCMIHNPGYDFNDAILPLGATYWVRLAETFLSRDGH